MRSTKLLAAALAVPALALASTAAAQDGDALEPRQTLDQAEAEVFNDGGIAVEFNTDITTHYFFRGILQENQGVIVQPSLEIGFDVTENDQVSAAGYVGIWNSFHSEQTGNTGSNEIWYESDLYGGVSFDLAGLYQGLSADVFYTAYTSPNGAFDTVQEVAGALGYSAEIQNIGVDFIGLIAFEIDGAADGGDSGIYGEFGVQPNFNVDIGNQELVLGVPVTLGFSIDDYYEGNGDDDTLGFVSVGVTTGIPLEFIDDKYGQWSLNGTITGMFLTGEDSTELFNNGDEFELIGTLGINMAY